MKSFQVELPSIYDFVYFKILSKKKFKKLIKEKFKSQDVLAFCENSTVYIPKSNVTNIPIVVHEIVHAVVYILDDKNIKDEEMLCYTIQYVLEKFLEFLKNDQN